MWSAHVKCCAGFEQAQLPRLGKQLPDAALVLDSSTTADQNIMHVLTLLQSPMPSEEKPFHVNDGTVNQPGTGAAWKRSSSAAVPQPQAPSVHIPDDHASDTSQQLLPGNALSSWEVPNGQQEAHMSDDTDPSGLVGGDSVEPASNDIAGILGGANRNRETGPVPSHSAGQAVPETPAPSSLPASELLSIPSLCQIDVLKLTLGNGEIW